MQSDEEYRKRLSDKQKEMISELKSSLADLESYAYEVSAHWWVRIEVGAHWWVRIEVSSHWWVRIEMSAHW